MTTGNHSSEGTETIQMIEAMNSRRPDEPWPEAKVRIAVDKEADRLIEGSAASIKDAHRKMQEAQRDLDEAEDKRRQAVHSWNQGIRELAEFRSRLANLSGTLESMLTSAPIRMEELIENAGTGPYYDDYCVALALVNWQLVRPILEKAHAEIQSKYVTAIGSLRELADKNNIPQEHWPGELLKAKESSRRPPNPQQPAPAKS